MTKDKPFLYEQIAGRFEEMIQQEVLKTGEKLPSIRSLSKAEGVSMSTVFQAYVLLEQKALVESRPKSGFYVRNLPFAKDDLPGSLPPKINHSLKRTDEIVRRVYGDLGKKDLVPFSMNMPAPELLPVQKLKSSALKVIRQQHESTLDYIGIAGSPALRSEIAKICFKKGINTTGEEVLITVGCMEAINLAIRACTQPGDTIAVESPTFFALLQAIESSGRKLVEVSARPEEGIDLRELENAITKYNAKACIVVTNFSNPLGAVLPDEKKKALVALMEKYGTTLIENDIYGEMYFGKSRPKTCKSFDKQGQVVLCSSFSKTVAPGYRIGYILPGKFHDTIQQAKLVQSIATSSLPQEIMADFLKNGRYDLHMKNMRKKLHIQSLQYARGVMEYFPKGTKMTQPQGGFVHWIELPRQVNATELFNDLIREGISIAPGQMFSKQANYLNYFRLSFGLPYNEGIDKALKRVGEAIRERL